MSEESKINTRLKLINAFEQKYGVPPNRLEINTLVVEPPDVIVKEFRSTADDVEGTMGAEWKQTIGEIATMSGENLATSMVPVYTKAFEKIRERLPTPAELEAVMSIGHRESNFGRPDRPKEIAATWRESHNHGAVQAGKPPCDPEKSFEFSDTSPQTDGTSKKYAICFKRYPNDIEGAADVVKHIGKDPLLIMKENGDSILAFCLGMYGNGYYESVNLSPKVMEAEAANVKAIQRLATRICADKRFSERFRTNIKRATEPMGAGRVLFYALGTNASAKSIAKSTGKVRATKSDLAGDSIKLTPKTVGGATAGAVIGGMVGGPVGSLLGAIAGYFGGSKL